MPTHRLLKIAFVATYDPLNIRAWSGTPYHMGQSLKNDSTQINYIGPLIEKFSLLFKIKSSFYKYALGKVYLKDREPAILKDYADQVSKHLSSLDIDIVFSPQSFPIAYLECRKPIVFWTDATFGGMIDFYPEFTNVCKETILKGHQMEMSAIHNAKLAIYSSDWAAETAKRLYQADSSRVKVVPFGANIECDRTVKDIQDIVKNKESNKCNLLFLGADWSRKGGEVALKVAKELNMQGLRTELTIVGCQPTISQEFSTFVKVLGFIPKSSQEGRDQIDRLLAQSHFLILPAKAECSPIVFCEANSFGVPCISTAVGGVTSVIRDGLNGAVFSKDANISEFCAFIYNIFTDYTKYTNLALSSFSEYQSRLNWTVAGEKVTDLLINLI